MRLVDEVSTLAELVHPMPQQEFLDYYVNQRPVFIHGGTPSRFESLINVKDVTEIIEAETFPGGRIWVVRDGEEIPPSFYTTRSDLPRFDLSRIRGTLNAGASLVLKGMQDTHRKIGDLAQTLELELSSVVHANGYVTMKQGGAFDIHYDKHDVIVVQVLGSKRWYLYGKTQEFPVDKFEKGMRSNAPKTEEQVDVLSAGEVLFVPRGEWHRAEVVESPSFHITLGISGPTGMEFVAEAAKVLSKEALFRKYFPRVGGQQLLVEYEKELKSLLHDWVDRLSVEAFLARRDGARSTRSEVFPWAPISLSRATKIRLALRRRSPIENLDREEIVIGGKAHRIGPTDRLVLQILGKHRVVRYDELISKVCSMRETIAEAELATSVVYLVECGLLNVSVGDKEGERDPKRELAHELE